MTDIESTIFQRIYDAVIKEFPTANIISEDIESPASFPTVAIVEQDNTVYEKTIDSSGLENHSKLMYTVNVYTNNLSNRKSEAKKIMSIADMAMQNMLFRRIMLSPAPNIDRSVYRLTARYTAIVGQASQESDKTVYQIYIR